MRSIEGDRCVERSTMRIVEVQIIAKGDKRNLRILRIREFPDSVQ